MKIRSSLLVACIVVVPLIAMFSHRIPPGARAAVVAFLRDVTATRRAPAPLANAPAVPLAAQPVVPATVQTAAVSSSSVSSVPAPDPTRLVPAARVDVAADSLDRLRGLGAIAIDCRPLLGHAGHVASCRVPVDGAGQLERVFQATGADAATAAGNLLRDVTAWRRGAAPPPSTMRF